MKKKYGALPVVISLISLGLAGGWAKTMLQVPAYPENIRVTSFAVLFVDPTGGKQCSTDVAGGSAQASSGD
jgi:hypothetical protein